MASLTAWFRKFVLVTIGTALASMAATAMLNGGAVSHVDLRALKNDQ
jgi:hypothetical protein